MSRYTPRNAAERAFTRHATPQTLTSWRRTCDRAAQHDNPEAEMVAVTGPDGVEYQLPKWAATMLAEEQARLEELVNQPGYTSPDSAPVDTVPVLGPNGVETHLPRWAAKMLSEELAELQQQQTATALAESATAVADASGWTVQKSRAVLRHNAGNADAGDDQTTVEFMKRQGYGNPSPSAKRDQAPKRDAADVDPTTIEFMRKQGY